MERSPSPPPDEPESDAPHTLRVPNQPGGIRGGPNPDTVVMYNPEIFARMGIQNIPLPEFRELSELIASHFGIKVGENKITLVTGRIFPMMEKYGFANHRECLDAIKNDSTGELLSELANRISTNHTAFYREEAHFDYLRTTVLPELTERKRRQGERDIRVWCAACATGEEAYTILFTLVKFLNFDYKNWRAGVLATDISASALETARRGVYNRQRIEPVPRDIVNLCFNQLDENTYEVKGEYRDEVTFRRLNLINDVYPFRQPFELIFCRNVMIYFSRRIRTQLLAQLHNWLVSGGYLFIGHSESMVGAQDGLEYLTPAVYRRTD